MIISKNYQPYLLEGVGLGQLLRLLETQGALDVALGEIGQKALHPVDLDHFVQLYQRVVTDAHNLMHLCPFTVSYHAV